MKVKIIKCSDPNFWYADKIGEVYEVLDLECSPDYIAAGVADDWRLVWREDYEILEEEQSPELTRSDLQLLKEVLKEDLRMYSAFVAEDKVNTANLWLKCNKDTYDGKMSFLCMNSYKDQLRADKAKLKKLIALQQKIKKLLT